MSTAVVKNGTKGNTDIFLYYFILNIFYATKIMILVQTSKFANALTKLLKTKI